jgi:predicted O-methyltransferase YrrM
VISLVALWAKLARKPCELYGISPFSSAGDSVSKYPQDLDYYQDTLANFDHFLLPHPNLIRAYSTDPEAVSLIESRQWDLIYIDGNHEYEIVKKDWDYCSSNLRPGGVIVLDDSGLATDFVPPAFASKGHPGPSRIAEGIDRRFFREILQVGHNRAFQKIPR